MNHIDNNNSNCSSSSGICLSEDVDLAAIAVKYELTGGFIKNAVLSALLIAINRNQTDCSSSSNV